MRRLWLQFQLWLSLYCTKHLRVKEVMCGRLCCPECQNEAYERWKHRLRLMREEYQDLNARR